MKPLRKPDPQRLEQFAYENRRDLTKAERAMETILRELGWRFNIEHPKGKMNAILDFFVPEKNLIIEVDGGYHITRKELDRKRDKYLVRRGAIVCRLTNEQVLKFPRKTRATLIKVTSPVVSDMKPHRLPSIRMYYPKISYPVRVFHER